MTALNFNTHNCNPLKVTFLAKAQRGALDFKDEWLLAYTRIYSFTWMIVQRECVDACSLRYRDYLSVIKPGHHNLCRFVKNIKVMRHKMCRKKEDNNYKRYICHLTIIPYTHYLWIRYKFLNTLIGSFANLHGNRKKVYVQEENFEY